MHGHGHGYGYPPPPAERRPDTGTLVALRVLFVTLSVLSCGLLSWAPLLRLAIVTQKLRDWALFGLGLLSAVGMMVFVVAAVPEDENKEISDAAALTFLLWVGVNVIGTVTYYLSTEIRHYERRSAVPYAVPAHSLPTAPQSGYGYPPVAQPPYTPSAPAPQPPAPQSAPPPQAQAQAQPQPQHIDQVRAELDELSDLLRRNQGQEGHGR
ncbi:hypothetical protein ACFPM3_21525 [Streptomyces coeruleoprunus]|uniref:Integral membrane protein n=1 Tax=Streptomyces coeruleoprunus TaxID=285563 RepID=A0ABV9XH19_9ACTN